jgi:allantoin racemase
MKILLLNVFKGETYELENCQKVARPDTEVLFEQARDYPLSHVRYEYFAMKAASGVVDRVVDAEKEGIDAVVITCMGDPGLFEARQLVDIPVVGIFEASTHLACMMGQKYSIITVSHDRVAAAYLRAKKYGVTEKLASIRHIGIPPPQLYPANTPLNKVVEKTLEIAKRCIAEDGAEVIVMGGSLSAAMFTKAAPEGLADVPIIDPNIAGFKTAEMMVDLRRSGLLTTSRVGFWTRPQKDELAQVREYFATNRVRPPAK